MPEGDGDESSSVRNLIWKSGKNHPSADVRIFFLLQVQSSTVTFHDAMILNEEKNTRKGTKLSARKLFVPA